jgi:hypothetical protein
MRRLSILIILGLSAILLAVSLPSAKAQNIPIVGECINATYLRTYIAANVSGSGVPVEFPSTYCPYGCVKNAGQYGDDCGIPYRTTNMTYEFYILLSIINFMAILLAWYRPNIVMFLWLPVVLSFSLALTSMDITMIVYDTMWKAFKIQSYGLTWLWYGLGFIQFGWAVLQTIGIVTGTQEKTQK